MPLGTESGRGNLDSTEADARLRVSMEHTFEP
jgi:hypothetical protein